MNIDYRIDAIVESCKNSGYRQNPVQILKYLQQKLITGWPLEILDPTSSEKGDTNRIMVDRENILETRFEHSPKKRKDSLETRAEPAVFSL